MGSNTRVTRGGSLRISIPVKVFILTGLVYLITWFMGQFMQWFAGLDFSASIAGIALGNLYMFLQVVLVAITATFGSHLFLERPIKGLKEAIERAKGGDFLMRVPVNANDELGELTSDFNKMLSSLTDIYANRLQVEHDIKIAHADMQNARRFEQKSRVMEQVNKKLENTVKELSMIYEIGQEVASVVDLDTLYQKVTETLRKFLKITQFAIMVYDSDADELYVKSSYGFNDNDIMRHKSFKRGECIFGMAFEQKKNFYSKESANDSLMFLFDGSRFEASPSFLSIPLFYKGEVLGVVNFGRDGIDSFNDSDIRMLELVAAQIALALANASLYTKTRELSVKDELTGLYNRRHLHYMLGLEWKRAVRFRRDLSGIMVDIDHFKNYNDTCGHIKGDDVLRQVGEMLRNNLREVDTVARFGGEEFFLLLPDTDKHGAFAVAEKVRNLFEQKNFTLGNGTNPKRVTICAGVASYPEDVDEMEDLIDHADIALYRAKEEGRNRVVAYSRTSGKNKIDGKFMPEEVTEIEPIEESLRC